MENFKQQVKGRIAIAQQALQRSKSETPQSVLIVEDKGKILFITRVEFSQSEIEQIQRLISLKEEVVNQLKKVRDGMVNSFLTQVWIPWGGGLESRNRAINSFEQLVWNLQGWNTAMIRLGIQHDVPALSELNKKVAQFYFSLIATEG